MSANNRLQNLQAALVARGVKDVKFFFTSSDKTSLKSLSKDVADFLDAVLAERVAPFPKIGDSVRAG